MSEIQDLLNASTQAMVDDYLIVDDNSREIYIPSGEILFGVTSDEKTERKYFQCPRIVGDNVDLTKYQLYINYQNANGEKDVYEITDVKTQDDTITFSWLLSRKVTEYQGTISFIICARNVNDSGVITNEWNTAIANGTCLIGLEASKQIAQENYDILEDVLKRLRLIEETGTSVDLSAYQKKTDEELKTTNKTIVGAINEIKDNQKNLPIATSELLGGVKPVSKTSEMTKEVGVDENGKLFVKEDITQEEITQLKNKSDFSGKWDDLEGKPTIPDAVTVDTTLSFTSTNPVQNKVITTELNKKLSTIPTATSTTLGGVKPITKTSSMTKDVGVDSNGRLFVEPDVTDDEKEKWNNKSDFDGSYNSLKNKPSFKTVNGVSIVGDGDIAVSGGDSSVTVDTVLNENSDNAISNKAVTTELNKKANTTDLGIDIITKTATDTDVLLENNTYYVFPEMSTLTITPPTAESGKLAICGFEFTSGSTATTLTLKNCTLTNSDDVVANKTYEVNILNGSAIVRER